MEMTRRSLLVYGLLVAIWALVGAWQVEEHARVKEAAKTDLRNRSKDIANTLSAFIRGLRFRGTGPVLQERLEPVLEELVGGTNELVKSSELISIVLLNAANDPVASAGRPIDFGQNKDILQEGERWGRQSVTLVVPVDLGTNTVVLPPRTNGIAEGPRPRGPRREPPPEPAGTDATSAATTNVGSSGVARDAREAPPPREGRPRRPSWWPPMDEKEMQNRAVHGLVLAMSTESLQAASVRDLWLRVIIGPAGHRFCRRFKPRLAQPGQELGIANSPCAGQRNEHPP